VHRHISSHRDKRSVLEIAAPAAFIVAAAFKSLLSIAFVFRHKAKWDAIPEIGIYSFVALLGAVFDLFITKLFLSSGAPAAIAKLIASALVLVLIFLGRRYLVFPLSKKSDWN